MTLAIMHKVPSPGDELDHFSECLKAARGRLTKWGYLAAGSDQGPATSMRLTMKGIIRNQSHEREGKGKSEQFDHLYVQLMEKGKDKEADGYNPDTPPEDKTDKTKISKRTPPGGKPKKLQLHKLTRPMIPVSGRPNAKKAKQAPTPKYAKSAKVTKVKKAKHS